MRHASLFSGIGGWEIVAKQMGWGNIFHCEKGPFCQKVLAYHYPESESFGDIKETDFNKYYGLIDVLSIFKTT